jgi:MFS family permease
VTGSSSPTGTRALLAEGKLYAVVSLTAIGVLGTTVVSPTLPGMATAFSLSDARVGLVVTAFFLPAAVLLPVVAGLADTVGRRPVALSSLFAFGAAGVAVGVAPSFEVVLALRVLQGVAFPGLIPLSIAAIGDLWDGTTATRVQGLRSGANGLTGVAVPTVAGVAAGLSWRLPYAIYAAAFLALVVCFLALPDPVDDADPPDGVAAGDPTLGPVGRVVGAVREVAAVLTRPLLAVVGATVTLFLVRYALVTYVPLYVVTQLGARDAVGGFAVAALGLGRLVGGPAAGAVVERIGRPATLFGTQGLFVAGTVMLALVPGPDLLLVAVAVLSLGEGVFNPVANDVVTAAAPTTVRARVVSVLEVGKTGAIAAAPVAFGALLAFGSYRVAFVVSAVLVAVVAVVVLVLYGSGDVTPGG